MCTLTHQLDPSVITLLLTYVVYLSLKLWMKRFTHQIYLLKLCSAQEGAPEMWAHSLQPSTRAPRDPHSMSASPLALLPHFPKPSQAVHLYLLLILLLPSQVHGTISASSAGSAAPATHTSKSRRVPASLLQRPVWPHSPGACGGLRVDSQSLSLELVLPWDPSSLPPTWGHPHLGS